MSGSPEPPPKKSTSGRVLSATKRKLTAPISTFVKSVLPKKKVKAAESDAASSVQQTPASSIRGQQPTPSVTSQRKVILSDEEDEDECSHRGDTLDPNSDIIMISNDEAEEDAEITAEEELERLAKEWTTGIYGFFKPDPIIEYVQGRRVHTFVCAATHCRGTSRNVRRFLDTQDAKSTSNLRRHALKCWGEDNVEAARGRPADEIREATKGTLPSSSITAAFERKGKGKVTFSHRQHTRTETRAEIVRWVAESSRPLNIVNDHGFQSLMKTGRPEYWIPSPSTVARDVKLVFAKTWNRIAQMLKKHTGTLSFATDAWSSPNHKAYVAVTVHFEQDGVPVSMLLDIVEVPCSHSGLNLAKAFRDILEDFGVAGKILSITCDNASNNGTMIVELSHLVPAFPGESNLVRCFNHVLSLVAKTAIRVFDVPEADKASVLDDATVELQELAKNIDLEDLETQIAGYEDDEDDGEVDSTDGWVDERLELSAVEREVLDESVLPVRLLLVKLRKLSYAIINSTTLLLPKWFSTLRDTKLDERAMPRDVSTRWNSTYDMLKFAIDYRKAIDRLTGDKNLGLRQYELSDDEWEIAGQLSSLLKTFKDATLYFSRATPNIPTVFPAMDHIDECLTTASVNDKLPASIRAAASLSKKTLNRYYERSDCSKVYRIAMVLDPRCKLEYFKTAKWEREWIDEAERLTRQEYNKSYRNLPVTPEDPSIVLAAQAQKNNVSSESNIFDSLPAFSSAQSLTNGDELSRYLAEDVVPMKPEEALSWWASKKKPYPRLSQMARDYLSIPATSVDVERVFSRGRILLSHLRNRLSPQTTRSLMCLQAWSLLGYVKDKDVLSVARLPEVPGDADEELGVGWDYIDIY